MPLPVTSCLVFYSILRSFSKLFLTSVSVCTSLVSGNSLAALSRCLWFFCKTFGFHSWLLNRNEGYLFDQRSSEWLDFMSSLCPTPRNSTRWSSVLYCRFRTLSLQRKECSELPVFCSATEHNVCFLKKLMNTVFKSILATT